MHNVDFLWALKMSSKVPCLSAFTVHMYCNQKAHEEKNIYFWTILHVWLFTWLPVLENRFNRDELEDFSDFCLLKINIFFCWLITNIKNEMDNKKLTYFLLGRWILHPWLLPVPKRIRIYNNNLFKQNAAFTNTNKSRCGYASDKTDQNMYGRGWETAGWNESKEKKHNLE